MMPQIALYHAVVTLLTPTFCSCRAYVVPATKDLTREEVAQWVEGKVAHYKKLRGGVLFVDVIPRSPAGKILRKILREEAKKERVSRL